MEFSEILKELRKENGFSARKLSTQLNCSISLIYDWEKKNCEPSFTTLSKLADIFDVSVDYLLGRESDYIKISPSKGQSTDRKLKFGDDELSADEIELIKDFRNLGIYAQGAIKIQVKALADEAQKVKK